MVAARALAHSGLAHTANANSFHLFQCFQAGDIGTLCPPLLGNRYTLTACSWQNVGIPATILESLP
jgi:hypothetical protein